MFAFLFFSGYLFYLDIHNFTRDLFYKKLKKRSTSLVIPYLLGNILMIILLAFQQKIIPNISSGYSAFIHDYTYLDWIKAVGFPISGQLWFIRDLFIACIFSPCIYYLVKRYKVYTLFLWGSIWFSSCILSDIQFFTIESIFFFSLGTYFSIPQKSFIHFTIPVFRIAILVNVILSGCIIYFMGHDNIIDYVVNVNILAEIVIQFKSRWCYYYRNKGRITFSYLRVVFYLHLPLPSSQFLSENFLYVTTSKFWVKNTYYLFCMPYMHYRIRTYSILDRAGIKSHM